MSICHVKGWRICLCLLAAQAKPAFTLYYSIFLLCTLMVILLVIILTNKSIHKLTGEWICWKLSCLRACGYSLAGGSWVEWMGRKIRPFPLWIHVAALEEYPKTLMNEYHLHWFLRILSINPDSTLHAHPSWSDPGPLLYFRLCPPSLSHFFLQHIFQLILFSQWCHNFSPSLAFLNSACATSSKSTLQS